MASHKSQRAAFYDNPFNRWCDCDIQLEVWEGLTPKMDQDKVTGVKDFKLINMGDMNMCVHMCD